MRVMRHDTLEAIKGQAAPIHSPNTGEVSDPAPSPISHTEELHELSTHFALSEDETRRILNAVAADAGNIEAIYPLSPLQEGMLFHNLLNSQADTYVLSLLFELDSGAAAEALTQALQQVV